MSSPSELGVAVVTGASSGIGKTYAQQLARRGHDLVLVARDRARLEALAAELRAATGRAVEVLPADLGRAEEVEALAARIESDPAITLLVNNAGMGTERNVVGADPAPTLAMVELNVVALTRLSLAAASAFSRRGRGALVNIASVVAFLADTLTGAYAGTKAFVLAFTQSLHNELKGGPVRVQAVLPGLTRTEFFDRAGLDASQLPANMMMSAEDLVAAALRGLDLGEVITIPSLRDLGKWEALEAARLALGPELSLDSPAERYRAA
ncbi:SDR family NAD(P)-dependent oxidoreductase [Ancylobacter oerskovii]|uniref:SDR family NAD(P)-dependent oxidoreductase n=1 Tax=Ancylobacter oerskovii TaxID=459519 RepID=A0ABW4YYJ1_9HYPH|nr:SDR family oxidoreductase [Ancylobacter oerskovii]MBS7541590.1 SDR family oxidoreductase [Ancylobacter oerskovii]